MLSKVSNTAIVALVASGILCLSGLAGAGQGDSIGSHADEVLTGKIYQKDSRPQHLCLISAER